MEWYHRLKKKVLSMFYHRTAPFNTILVVLPNCCKDIEKYRVCGEVDKVSCSDYKFLLNLVPI